MTRRRSNRSVSKRSVERRLAALETASGEESPEVGLATVWRAAVAGEYEKSEGEPDGGGR